MSTIEQSVEVNVPVRTAYNQWTQFEDFPRFMEGVEEVKQITDTRLRWRAEIAGQEREWEAEIDEQRRTNASPGTLSTAARTPAW